MDYSKDKSDDNEAFYNTYQSVDDTEVKERAGTKYGIER